MLGIFGPSDSQTAGLVGALSANTLCRWLITIKNSLFITEFVQHESLHKSNHSKGFSVFFYILSDVTC